MRRKRGICEKLKEIYKSVLNIGKAQENEEQLEIGNRYEKKERKIEQ